MPRGIPNKKRVVQTSDAPVKKVRGFVPVDSEALLAKWKHLPNIDVLSRRFLDPHDPGSLPILLADEASDCCVNSDHQYRLKDGATTCHICKKPARIWLVRWVNTTMEGRWGQIRSKGYIRVEVSELKDEQDVSDLVRQKESEGSVYVRRGDRGAEVLCKMPLAIYNYLKRSQRELQRTRNNSKKRQQDELAEAAGAELGDEAGQMIHGGGIMVESMKRERTTLSDEADSDTIDA